MEADVPPADADTSGEIGAVKPASDCGTRITWHAPMASMTRSAYAERPACSSSPGRSTAIASCAALYEQRHDAMPVPGHAASTGNENECSHGSGSKVSALKILGMRGYRDESRRLVSSSTLSV